MGGPIRAGRLGEEVQKMKEQMDSAQHQRNGEEPHKKCIFKQRANKGRLFR